MSLADPETLLRALFSRAVAVADPMRAVPRHLPERPPGRVVVVGAGKASARMAEAVEHVWGPCEGLVITRHGHARPTRGIEVVEAGHPLPDRAGLAASARMLALLEGLGKGDFVLALISGGASALLEVPAPGITLNDLRTLNGALLASGAPIGEINTLRKHISRVKGGRLAAAAHPARMLALMISDVPGDSPGEIGSGPTVGEASTPAKAHEVLAHWHIEAPASVRAALAREGSVIRPDDPRLWRVENVVIASPGQSLAAAATLARAEGIEACILGDALEGEARVIGAEQGRLGLRLLQERRTPLVLLSGGELTVTRQGDGIGGPNAEYALSLALTLDGADGIHALACDTDGIDGAAEVAGAVIGPETLARARRAGADPVAALAANDAHRLFAAAGAHVVTGPTLTNVNDFRVILIAPSRLR